MTAPPKRRWFRFSLRTMFVVVTVFGVYLASEANLAHRRMSALAAMNEDRGETYAVFGTMEGFFALGQRVGYTGGTTPRTPKQKEAGNIERGKLLASVSWLRQLMGDHPIVEIYASESAVERFRSLFPESDVRAIP